jgi:SdpC family antimicrobial peptide
MKSIFQAVIVVLGLAFAVTSCGSNPVVEGLTPETTQAALLKDPNLDGQAIFRGIAFGEKTVGEVLPEIWRGTNIYDLAPSKTDSDSSLKTINSFMSKLASTDAKFFPALSKSMRSGNPLEVEAALVRVGKVVEGMFPSDIAPVTDVALKTFIWKNRFLVKNRVIGTDKYVVRSAWINLYKIIFAQENDAFSVLFSDSNLKALQQETLIASLTKRLAI